MNGFVELVHAVEHLQGIRFIILERLEVRGTIRVCAHGLVCVYLAVYRPEPFPSQQHELTELCDAWAEHDDLRIRFLQIGRNAFPHAARFRERTAQFLIFLLEPLFRRFIPHGRD